MIELRGYNGMVKPDGSGRLQCPSTDDFEVASMRVAVNPDKRDKMGSGVSSVRMLDRGYVVSREAIISRSSTRLAAAASKS